jgi:hypothetical protein
MRSHAPPSSRHPRMVPSVKSELSWLTGEMPGLPSLWAAISAASSHRPRKNSSRDRQPLMHMAKTPSSLLSQ